MSVRKRRTENETNAKRGQRMTATSKERRVQTTPRKQIMIKKKAAKESAPCSVHHAGKESTTES